MTPLQKKQIEEPKIESKLVKGFKAARRVSVPILGIETPDPAATIEQLAAVLNGGAPVFAHDIVGGLRPVNKVAEALSQAQPEFTHAATMNPVEMLRRIEKLPTGSAVFVKNAHRFMSEAAFVQAVWNLRDIFKLNRRSVILLAPALRLPAELSGDVVMLSEPLPTREQLREVISQQHRNAELPEPSGAEMDRALDAVIGLPHFAAEQVVAMSLTKAGIDHGSLWDRKCAAIEQTDGLKVYRGSESFEDLRGVDNVVAFLRQFVEANAFGAVVFIDEGEKAFAGGMSDHTGDGGVAKDQVGQLLTYIQDTGSLGVLLAGLPGSGKSALAKATGNAAGKPTISMDLGGAKKGIVGASEDAIRNILKVITATAEGRVLFIMTANDVTSFSPEINRRFPDRFFFDNPDDDGLAALFDLYGKKNKLSAEQLARPEGFARGWTGAEVKRACERASMFKCSVVEASRYLVPQAESARDKIERLREQAAGRFLSANYPGVYNGAPALQPKAQAADAKRSIRLED